MSQENSFVPKETRQGPGGPQRLFWFGNGYGASVIRHQYSYGGAKGLFELAVLSGSLEDFQIDYNTPITSSVIGYLEETGVQEILTRISQLPKKEV